MAETDDRMKKVPLVGYLIKPVQRATRYPLLIKVCFLKNKNKTTSLFFESRKH